MNIIRGGWGFGWHGFYILPRRLTLEAPHVYRWGYWHITFRTTP